MNPKIVEKISPEIALEMMNEIVSIHNLLAADHENEAFYRMGSLVEQLAQRVRFSEKEI